MNRILPTPLAPLSMRTFLLGAAAAASILAATAGAQGPIDPCNCGVQSPFTPSAPCPPSQVTKAWGGRYYSSFHRRLGTPPNHADFLWVGEDGGRISFSTDEGVTWTNQPVPRGVKGEVRGLYFLDDAVTGWAVTSDGWVLSTLDGGACWQQLSYLTYCDEPAELFDVYFFGPLRGFLGGGHVLKSTIDGGVTWNDEPVDNAFPLCVINEDAEVYAFDVAGGSRTTWRSRRRSPGRSSTGRTR